MGSRSLSWLLTTQPAAAAAPRCLGLLKPHAGSPRGRWREQMNKESCPCGAEKTRLTSKGKQGLPCFRKPLGLCCFSAWNVLPPDICRAGSIISLKSLFRTHLLRKVVPDYPHFNRQTQPLCALCPPSQLHFCP